MCELHKHTGVLESGERGACLNVCPRAGAVKGLIYMSHGAQVCVSVGVHVVTAGRMGSPADFIILSKHLTGIHFFIVCICT